MVVDNRTARADRVFHALADPTRRDIVRRALGAEHSVSALARAYPMSVAAVQKHVAVLERAGLVTKVVTDKVMAQVEMQCGPFTVVSLMSTDAVRELGLEVGSIGVAIVKATTVIVETP